MDEDGCLVVTETLSEEDDSDAAELAEYDEQTLALRGLQESGEDWMERMAEAMADEEDDGTDLSDSDDAEEEEDDGEEYDDDEGGEEEDGEVGDSGDDDDAEHGGDDDDDSDDDGGAVTDTALTVFVGNLDFSTTKTQVLGCLASCGAITGLLMPKNSKGQPAGYAFVQFADAAGKQAALQLNGKRSLKGRSLEIGELSARALQKLGGSSATPSAAILPGERAARGLQPRATDGASRACRAELRR